MKHKNRHIVPSFAVLAVLLLQLTGCSGPAMEKSDMTEQVEKDAQGRVIIPSADVLASLPPDGGKLFNRLVFEQSPYLLQHAANPVDWYPWSEEAFERARKENKPVFLSVGYSTCHWCHVMEHESFEDEEVAALLNRDFICIKVDREERPDVDKIYMDVTQAMTGSGGWPMTVVMTPDKKPFFSGTYFPKEGRAGRPGMLDLVPQLAQAWTSMPERVLAASEQIMGALKQMNSNTPGGKLTEETLNTGYQQLVARFDAERGGFAMAPKFPVPHNITFLLRYALRTSESKATQMVAKTLTEMRRGGIFDHVGFGFHRYSTDPNWLLPHFEKMLYDQALITMAYVEAYQATAKEEYASTAREIITYVLRDMTSPEGGFYSAEDADSEGEEGKFYVWTRKEIEHVLGKEEGELYFEIYNMKDGGNFVDQASGQRTGDSIPHLSQSIAHTARDRGVEEKELRTRLEEARKKLFKEREKRIHPIKDDKILTDWNGLMIAALAKAGQALEEPAYIVAARKAADFVLSNMRNKNGRLLKRYRTGKAGLPAHLEDYAFMIWGLLDLYEATFEPRYLEEAITLNEIVIWHFWDDAHGGFYLTADDGEKLLVRGKEIYDGALPSGNSVAALNLVRLARMTGEVALEEKAEQILDAFAGSVERGPSAYAQLLLALDFARGPSHEIVVVGDPREESTLTMLATLRKYFIPNKVVLLRDPNATDDRIQRIAPYTAEMKQIDDKATAYVCQNFACELPTTNTAEILESLGVEPVATP